jgi:GNAT superfamily N-acetyltransferase
VLQERDLGHRVVVRHRTPRGPTDVLGQLTALDSERLVVRTEHGDEREIRRADVIAGKTVPARPPRYSEIISLERIANQAWLAPEIDHIGDWLLRAAEGWTNRANSALPLGEAGMSVDDATEFCWAWYHDRGLLPKITVPLPVRRDVAAHLEATGWTAQPRVLVQAATLVDKPVPAAPVRLHEHPSAEFLTIIGARKTSLPASALRVMLNAPAVRFAEVRSDDGTLLAIARGAVVEDWLHVGLVEVVRDARRRGLARAVSLSLATWARERGATRAVLQVEERNVPAVRLYAGLGFSTHHTYVTYHRGSD